MFLSKSKFLLGVLSLSCSVLWAQTVSDSIVKPFSDTVSYLPNITVVGSRNHNDWQQMPEIVGTNIYAGKKNCLIVVDNVQGNTALNTMRQVVGKVAGVHIWESDASGIQIGIAARGLSPNRSWEFNVRQNGYDIAADPYGYPEAYYNPQLQAVQRIEIVRGQGALQYGPQFGGLVNYILKNGSEIKKPFAVETQQTFGANGLFSAYNAIGGKTKKWHYYGFFDHKNGEGWRKNSHFETNTGFLTATYCFSPKYTLTAELMRWGMSSQQAGGLTDAQFANNAQQSLRGRNWFGLTWTTAALIGNIHFGAQHDLNIKLFSVLGDRNSIGFMPSAGITVKDSINTTTRDFNPRTVDIDKYRNLGLEARYLKTYTFLNQKNTLSAGIRLYKGNTHRFKTGKGSTGSDADFGTTGLFNDEIDYNTLNTAAFAEHIFRFFNEKLLLIPGLRYEWISAAVDGYKGIKDGQGVPLVPQSRARSFVLGGLGVEYHTTKTTELYANFAQAYRPLQFADLTTPPTTDLIDPNLTDANGFNADLGFRGSVKQFLQFDITAYWLQYNNRVGTLLQQRADGSFYNLRTNVGSSSSKGIEAYAEINPIKAVWAHKNVDVTLFTAYAYTDARYENLKVLTKVGSALVESNLRNKQVENAPQHILRAGSSYRYKGFGVSLQYAFTDKAFADANNTEAATANGQNGLIPAYGITDLSFAYRRNAYQVKAGINNLFDTRYFTRRAGGFPGPGILPADGRTWFITLSGRF